MRLTLLILSSHAQGVAQAHLGGERLGVERKDRAWRPSSARASSAPACACARDEVRRRRPWVRGTPVMSTADEHGATGPMRGIGRLELLALLELGRDGVTRSASAVVALSRLISRAERPEPLPNRSSDPILVDFGTKALMTRDRGAHPIGVGLAVALSVCSKSTTWPAGSSRSLDQEALRRRDDRHLEALHEVRRGGRQPVGVFSVAALAEETRRRERIRGSSARVTLNASPPPPKGSSFRTR